MEKSLEIRINSVDDAKSVVANSVIIYNFLKDNSINSIEFLIEESIKSQVMPIIVGIFNCKVYYSIVKAKDNNIFYPIPHYSSTKYQEA